MFRENRQIYLDKADTVKKLGNPFSSAESRAGVLNSNEEAMPHNSQMLEDASKEFKNPISTIFKSTRQALATVLWDLPKSAIKNTLALTTDIVTGSAGLVANIPRWGIDLARLVPRVPLIILDEFGSFYGKHISTRIRNTREKIHSMLGTESFINPGMVPAPG